MILLREYPTVRRIAIPLANYRYRTGITYPESRDTGSRLVSHGRIN
jgi:hypothetical protein